MPKKDELKEFPESKSKVSPAEFLQKHLTIVLVAAIVLIIGAGFLIFRSVTAKSEANLPDQEMELPFDPDGPYVLLIPRRDGNALFFNLKRVGEFDSYNYTLSYTDQEGIERGAGSFDTWVPIEKGKAEYEQEILFGTCSKNVCKYDQGVKNGTLSLKLKKKNITYTLDTLWHIQQADIALGEISSVDEHFKFKTEASREELTNTGFTIVNEVSGTPKLPKDKSVFGKVYALNVTTAKSFPAGNVTIELAETPMAGAQIGYYLDTNNEWKLLETKAEGSTLTAASPSGNGIFTVLVNKQ